MAYGDDVPSMESLIQDLASSRLDASSPPKRKEVIKIAAEHVTENENDRQALASLTGEQSRPFST